MRIITVFCLFFFSVSISTADTYQQERCRNHLLSNYDYRAVTDNVKLDGIMLRMKFRKMPETKHQLNNSLTDAFGIKEFQEMLSFMFFNESSIGSIIKHNSSDWLAITVHQGPETHYDCVTYRIVEMSTAVSAK